MFFFESVKNHWRGDVVAVLLTGMGRDGAKGLNALRGAGAFTIAQDAGSCVRDAEGGRGTGCRRGDSSVERIAPSLISSIKSVNRRNLV